jgi:phage/plasmid-associated DNA primase
MEEQPIVEDKTIKSTSSVVEALKKHFGNDVVRVKDHLNQKQGRFNSILKWNSKYWEPYTLFEGEILKVFEGFEDIASKVKQEEIEKVYMSEITINETDINCEDIICTPNGIIDLKKVRESGKGDLWLCRDQWLHPHEEYKCRYITMCTRANYKSVQDRDLSFFDKILRNNLLRYDEVQDWFFIFLAGLLYGRNRWQQFILFLGRPRSGKTTLINFIASILDSYAFAIKPSILSKEDDAFNVTLYHHRKCRLLHYDDPGKKKIDESLIKRMTGESTFSIRDVNFQVSAHLVIDSNYMLESTDSAFIDRLVPIPFGQTRQETDRNPDLNTQLAHYRDDVFSLMVDHITQYIEAKPSKPPIAEEVLNKYNKYKNPIETFYDTYCQPTNTNTNIKASKLYSYFLCFFSKYVKESKIEREVNDFFTQLAIDGVFLFDEEVLKEAPSQTEFNTKIKVLHPKFTNTNNELTLQGIIFREDKQVWGEKQNLMWGSPVIQSADGMLGEVKQSKAKIRTVCAPEQHFKNVVDNIQEELNIFTPSNVAFLLSSINNQSLPEKPDDEIADLPDDYYSDFNKHNEVTPYTELDEEAEKEGYAMPKNLYYTFPEYKRED